MIPPALRAHQYQNTKRNWLITTLNTLCLKPEKESKGRKSIKSDSILWRHLKIKIRRVFDNSEHWWLDATVSARVTWGEKNWIYRLVNPKFLTQVRSSASGTFFAGKYGESCPDANRKALQSLMICSHQQAQQDRPSKALSGEVARGTLSDILQQYVQSVSLLMPRYLPFLWR